MTEATQGQHEPIEPKHIDRMAATVAHGFASLPEGFPAVNITMFFTEHGTADDLGSYPQYIEANNYIIREESGWQPHHMELLQEVLQTSPESASNDLVSKISSTHRPHPAAIVGSLLGAHKKLLNVDVPDGHPIVERYEEFERDSMTYVELDGDLVLTFDDTLEIIDGLATVHAEIQRDREERMIAQLFNELGTKVDPHMPVNILWSIGSAHTALYDALNKGMQATDGTIKKVFSFGDGREYKYSVQIVQDKMMGVEPTEDSLAKAWLSDYIQEIIQASPRPVGHSHIQDEQVRLIADRFSLDEIKAVFDTPARKDAITKAIKTKGIKLSARKPPKIISFVR